MSSLYRTTTESDYNTKKIMNYYPGPPLPLCSPLIFHPSSLTLSILPVIPPSPSPSLSLFPRWFSPFPLHAGARAWRQSECESKQMSFSVPCQPSAPAPPPPTPPPLLSLSPSVAHTQMTRRGRDYWVTLWNPIITLMSIESLAPK